MVFEVAKQARPLRPAGYGHPVISEPPGVAYCRLEKVMDCKKYQDLAVATAISAGAKILAALAIFGIGLWLIGLAMRLVERSLRSHKIDSTLMAYPAPEEYSVERGREV